MGMPAEEKAVGRRLQALRKAAGLSQRELGAVLNISHTSISFYETGTSQIDADALPRFAEALGVAPSAFFEEATEQDPQRAVMLQLFEDFLTWSRLQSSRRGRIVWSNGTVRPEKAVPDAFASAFSEPLDPTPSPSDGVLAVA
jgi:transcriptional regulator with XRE-family HTH domain